MSWEFSKMAPGSISYKKKKIFLFSGASNLKKEQVHLIYMFMFRELNQLCCINYCFTLWCLELLISLHDACLKFDLMVEAKFLRVGKLVTMNKSYTRNISFWFCFVLCKMDKYKIEELLIHDSACILTVSLCIIGISWKELKTLASEIWLNKDAQNYSVHRLKYIKNDSFNVYFHWSLPTHALSHTPPC